MRWPWTRRLYRHTAALPASFRLTIPPYGRYFVVCIHETLEAMRETVVECSGAAHPRLTACCIACHTAADPGLCGVLCFTKGELGAGVVAHELAHATFRALERDGVHVRHWRNRHEDRDWRGRSTHEEQYAGLLERLTREFWLKAYAGGYAHPG